jgi:4-amino-4-deoxy-L-arabinose transferase-like glycosyltransferase
MMPFLFKLYCIMPLKRGIHFYLVLGLFTTYLINGLIAIPRNSVTYDEMDHWSYGKRILMRKTDKIYPYDDAGVSPFYGINAIPRAVQQIINPELRKTDGGFSDIIRGRYVSLLICMLIGLFIYRWSKELYGEKAGLLSLFMFVFCPNLNGHSILFTSDCYTALFLLMTCYYFWKFIKESGWKNFLLYSFCFAIAQIIKYSLVHLFVIIGLLSIVILLYRKTLVSNWKNNLWRLLVFLLIQLLVINVSFQFNGTGQKLKDYHFRSALFQSIQASSVINKVPFPLPVPYVEGFDVTYHMMELGAGHPYVSAPNYLFGEMRIHKGFWYYYFVVLFFKTPIPYLLLLLLAGWLYFKNKKLVVTSAEFIMGSTALYYFLMFSFINEVQIGIRHLLLLYPLLYILAGRVATIDFKRRTKNIAFGLFAVYSITTFYFYFPNLISYTNEFIPDKKSAYKVFADTNLDYGQGAIAADRYLKEHKDVKYADSLPSAGKFITGVNHYLGLDGTDSSFAWIKNFKPVGHVDHSYLLFDIKEEELKKLPAFNRRDSLEKAAN